MARYIDADKLMNEIDKLKKSPWYNEDFGISAIRLARHDGLEIVVDLCIKRAPTADVQEVRHGKWSKSQAITGIDPVTLEFTIGDADRCSVCDTEFISKKRKYKYCPECGAKMDGKED